MFFLSFAPGQMQQCGRYWKCGSVTATHSVQGTKSNYSFKMMSLNCISIQKERKARKNMEHYSCKNTMFGFKGKSERSFGGRVGGHCGGGGTSHYSVSLSAYGSFPRFSWRPATLMLTRMLRLTAVTTTLNMKLGEEEENRKLVYTSRPAWALVLILQSLFFLKPIFSMPNPIPSKKLNSFETEASHSVQSTRNPPLFSFQDFWDKEHFEKQTKALA